MFSDTSLFNLVELFLKETVIYSTVTHFILFTAFKRQKILLFIISVCISGIEFGASPRLKLRCRGEMLNSWPGHLQASSSLIHDCVRYPFHGSPRSAWRSSLARQGRSSGRADKQNFIEIFSSRRSRAERRVNARRLAHVRRRPAGLAGR